MLNDGVAEWSNARDSKSCPFEGPGSNPGVIDKFYRS